MIRKGILLKLFDSAYMQRWNDKIRPVELIELDKQAHKMIAAYVLARLEEDGGGRVDWIELIEGGIFDLLQRVVITDLKPQIYYKIKEDRQKYRLLNDWVYQELRPVMSPLGEEFCRRFRDYFSREEEESTTRRILLAAHLYATRWEFAIVERANPGGYEIGDIKGDIDAKQLRVADLAGVVRLQGDRRFRNFLDLCGQLRFQTRWAHLHRIPRTSVLGHSLYVAILSYLFSLEIGACPRRRVNNYLTGLFHDLPEVLTRDIISPVKRSVEGLSSLIKEYEKEMMEKEIYGLIPAGWRDEFAMFSEFEFENFAFVDGVPLHPSLDEISRTYNEDRFNPRDGELVKRADSLAAFVEAWVGIRNGSVSPDLQEGKFRIREKEEEIRLGPLDFGEIYSDFD